MNFSQQDLDPNEAYLPAPDGNTAESPWRLYVEFIAFVFQTILKSVSSRLVNMWRQPVLRAVLLSVCGSVVVWGISWADKPEMALSGPIAFEFAPTTQPTEAEVPPTEDEGAAEPPVEEPALKVAVETPIIPVAQQGNVSGFMPVSFTVSGEWVAGAPLAFSVLDHVPGRKYQINFGNGIKKDMGTSLIYTYPKKGIFLVVLVAQEGDELRSSDQVIEIKAATPASDTESSEAQSVDQVEMPPAGADEAASAQDFRPTGDPK